MFNYSGNFGLSLACTDHDILASIGQFALDQFVTVFNIDRIDTDLARIAKQGQTRFFDDASASGHEQEFVLIECLDGYDGRDALSFGNSDEVYDGSPPGTASDLGQFMHLQPVALAQIREEQNIMMRRCDE